MTTRTMLLGSIALLALGNAASAADMAVKAPLAVPSPYVTYDPFTGAYIGANVGYGWDLGTTAAAFQGVPLGNLSLAPQGFVGGFQAGYGIRFSNILYAGLEGDIDGAALTGTATMPGIITMTSKNSWLTSIRGEFGIIPVGHALFYGTVGWGWGGGQFTINDATGAQLASQSPTMNGVVWGAGVKLPLSPNWIVDVKYLQYDFGNINTLLSNGVGVAPTIFTTKDRVDVVRMGLNYKF